MKRPARDPFYFGPREAETKGARSFLLGQGGHPSFWAPVRMAALSHEHGHRGKPTSSPDPPDKEAGLNAEKETFFSPPWFLKCP